MEGLVATAFGIDVGKGRKGAGGGVLIKLWQGLDVGYIGAAGGSPLDILLVSGFGLRHKPFKTEADLPRRMLHLG